MMRIGEMYRRSGGSTWNHNCEECNFFKPKRVVKLYGGKEIKLGRCTRYKEEVPWKSNYVACKYFKESKGDKS